MNQRNLQRWSMVDSKPIDFGIIASKRREEEQRRGKRKMTKHLKRLKEVFVKKMKKNNVLVGGNLPIAIDRSRMKTEDTSVFLFYFIHKSRGEKRDFISSHIDWRDPSHDLSRSNEEKSFELVEDFLEKFFSLCHWK